MSPLFDRLRSRTAAFAHDLATVPVAWLLAYWLRFNLGEIPADFRDGALIALPLVIVIHGTVFWLFGLYRGVWRFASLPDLIRISKAVFAGTALTLFALFAFNRMGQVPRSVPVLFLGLELSLLAGPRLLYRWFKDHRLNLRAGERVLIVGAEREGEMLVRDMLRDPRRAYLPVAFVDDRPRRLGGEVHGVPVRGATERIPELTITLGIDLILLATPSASACDMRRLVALCEESGRPFRTVPQLENLMSGQVSISHLRPVSIEDLLGRNPVTLDWPGIRAGLAGRDILVTGAGGSIGSELCRQIAATGPRRLILVDNGEFNLYRSEMELVERYPGLPLARHLVDVTDAEAVTALFRDVGPQIVFHAAAYKHVPLLEDQVRAALRNNVVGTQIVAEAAHAIACERFVLISTDKAVNPTNVMGATKRISEALCQALDARSSTRYITVRFGNVLDSAGSVVPLFRRQIEQGGPVTVTHPEIERFFMTIPEACQLIMQAAVIGEGGEIFVLDMGDPIKIRYLAEQMIHLSGRRPEVDIPIKYIGLRPGEKLYEELFYRFEELVATGHPKIRVARSPARWADAGLEGSMATLSAALGRCDEAELRDVLRGLLPEWHSPAASATADALLSPFAEDDAHV
jgi:FlaA1/EpsC-like NDP-sugar epimerase